MLNRAILIGRLTKDPELKTTPNGVAVTTFSIAVDRKYSGKGEEKKTDFFNIVAWRGTAEFIAKYFSKGRAIAVQGEIQNRSYTDKDGNTRYVTEIVADSVHFTGEAKASGNGQAGSHTASTSNRSNTAAMGNVNDFVGDTSSDDDYPF